MSKIDKATELVLNHFPKIKQPFELDSDGLFFLDILVGKITKNLVDFYNDYELILGGHCTSLELKNIKEAYTKILSLPYFLGIKETEINTYLNEVCEHHKVTDNMFYMEGTTTSRLAYISNMLMQKAGIYPLNDYFILDGDRKIPKSETSQTLIKSILFEIISLNSYCIETDNGMTTEFITESFLNLYKIMIIFKIDESI